MPKITIGPVDWKIEDINPGDFYEGGNVVCISGGTFWIVAPNTTEVSRNWYSRDDAVTTAQASASCGDWFVPTCGQLQNPGYTCRTYWDSYSSGAPEASYWSNQIVAGAFGCRVRFTDGSAATQLAGNGYCVRAFRCVSY